MPRRRRRSSRYLSAILALAALAAAGLTIHQLRLKNQPAPLIAEDSSPVVPAAPVVDPARKPLVESSALFTQTPSIALLPKKPATKPVSLNDSFPSSPLKPLSAYPSTPSTPSVAIEPATRPTIPAGSFSDAKSLAESGKLVEARDLLNSVLPTLSDASLVSAKEMLTAWNKEIIFGKKIYTADPNQVGYTVPMGGVLQKIAQSNNITWELLANVNGISDPTKLRAGQTIKLLKGPFNAVVDKKRFTLEIYHGVPGETGAMFLTQFPVGLGKDDSTPAGSWKVTNKLKNPTYYSPRGEGVIPASDPRNPLGEFWIGLDGLSGNAVGKQSYGIHGTIEPDTIGKMASMGCIRLLNEDIAMVYSLLVEGKSTVFIKE